ncbi:MAG: hypothetical protein OER96_03415 [Gammaproteobacteria bacterium]|nr:hypothetical protein [Gammaproteobacteria bacterium]
MYIHLSNFRKIAGISLACAALWPFVCTAQDGGVIGTVNPDAQVEKESLDDMNKELKKADPLPTPEVVTPSDAQRPGVTGGSAPLPTGTISTNVPQEEYWTPERMKSAKPRSATVCPDGGNSCVELQAGKKTHGKDTSMNCLQ